ncbi:uncharacterized protein LOC133531573 [Cydia pomonella]|uniref:uncharacterized protein LOC133531573 n=1 Tax=Cydia pomonella TaxID=82600 RepID=UPI002ADDBC6A|nr:uncharacterized protein LOC133531573 [Cydia pomonella]
MDPITVLQSRIEQLEAKLGLAVSPTPDGQQGDSATSHLLNTAQTINNATLGHEKLSEAVNMAHELNNYTNPNFVEISEQSNKHKQVVTAAEPVLHYHCSCMHRCKQAVPVLESEPIQHVPEMQASVDNMHQAAAEVKAEADAVSLGIQEIAETCGVAAAAASEQLAGVARHVEQAEQKLFPQRRNGLD